MMNPTQWILSYDVGGSHVSAGLVRLPDFELPGVQSRSIDSSLGADEIMEAFVRLGQSVAAGRAGQEIAGMGWSMPGPFDYRRGICLIKGLAKYEQLYGVDFRAVMASRFRGIPGDAIRFINDAAAALLGEIQAGAAKGKTRVIGLTLGTGIGSAFAVAGRIVTSGRGVPPEGYVYNLPWKDGIVEDVVSSRGVRKEYARLAGEDLDVREIARKAPNTPIAGQVMQWFGRTLGEVLLPLVKEFEPEVVVLGGAIARSADLFVPAAMTALRENRVELRSSNLEGRSGLIGAAVAWYQGQVS